MRSMPLYISPKGGTIDFSNTKNSRKFVVCYENTFLYVNNINEAKSALSKLEELKSHSSRMSLKLINKNGDGLKNLVESAAAPYLEE